MRLTPYRKAEICAQLMRGEETFAAQMRRHGLSMVELMTWLDRFQRHGISGLSVSHREAQRR